ncbi:MAG: undecaprenyl-diphosphate phosphatase [Acidimicrobiia bacterium]|nr:undecaprenyl-diphosphate phosphatase [Acidimicrobiia bacterium]
MFQAIVWGLVQGLTEFLPISSSGHLVLVPAFLGIDQPDLATSAVLHLGTLTAVVAYYRRDLLKLTRFNRDPGARRVLGLLALGTVPAVIGVFVEDQIGSLQEDPTAVALALLVTGVVLFFSGLFMSGRLSLERLPMRDGFLIGVAQAIALVPGISRSGMTITAGMTRNLERSEAARFSFLLAIPAIAGAGAQQGLELAGNGGIGAEVWVGMVIAALSGYMAIALLLRLLTRFGLRPFAIYCFAVGIVALIAL